MPFSHSTDGLDPAQYALPAFFGLVSCPVSPHTSAADPATRDEQRAARCPSQPELSKQASNEGSLSLLAPSRKGQRPVTEHQVNIDIGAPTGQREQHAAMTSSAKRARPHSEPLEARKGSDLESKTRSIGDGEQESYPEQDQAQLMQQYAHIRCDKLKHCFHNISFFGMT